MSIPTPTCQTIQVFTFRGDRSRSFSSSFQRKLNDEKNGVGPGPTNEECLLYAGHTGVSTDGGHTIHGFNPDGAGTPTWKVLDLLKNGDRFHGVVRDDTSVFAAAKRRGLNVHSFDIVLPDPIFSAFLATLDGERWKSQHYYGFPNGDGDCDCTTWLERLGLPLLSGRMGEFIAMLAIASHPSRRFGLCI